MSERIRVACVQLTSCADKAANLERAEALVERAAAAGADVVVLRISGTGSAVPTS